MKPSLMHVVGPLVRLLGKSDLTWQDRANISEAIFVTIRHWGGTHLAATDCSEAQETAPVVAQFTDGARDLGQILRQQPDVIRSPMRNYPQSGSGGWGGI